MLSITTLRRRAYRQDLRLVSIREGSRWYSTYGPYALADSSTGALVAYGLDLESVGVELGVPDNRE